MPGFTTHYLFGVQTYRVLSPGNLKNCIKDHHAAYCLGLQGPDVFFYYPTAHLSKENIGSAMHGKGSAKLFSTLLEYKAALPDREEREILTAYMAGFLGHYTLDSIFHPYVYAKTGYKVGEKSGNEYYGRHFELESCLDILFLKKLKGQRPEQFHQSRTICLPRAEQRTVARLLSSLSQSVYHQHYTPSNMYRAISCMRIGTALLHDSTGYKKKLYSWIEKHLWGYQWLSPMFQASHEIDASDVLNETHQGWKNPWKPCAGSTVSAWELFQKALDSYHETLTLLELSCVPIAGAEERLRRNIGNRSFHSGLESLLFTARPESTVL